MNVRKLLCELTAEEKAALVAGTDFMYTNPIPRLGIKSLRMSDGPHGLRVQAEGGDNGVTGSLPATAFPTAACTASGWNPENVRKMGNRQKFRILFGRSAAGGEDGCGRG